VQLVDQQAAMESEKVVLQSVLLDNELFCFAERLRPEHFQNSYHREIFKAIERRVKGGEQVDEVILADMFPKNHGLTAYIMDFNAAGTRKIAPHVQEVIRAAHRRKIIQEFESALLQARDASEDNESVLSVTYDKLVEMAEYGQSSDSLRLSEFSDVFYDYVMKLSTGAAKSKALSSGLTDLDELTGGLHPGEFVVIGGWTNEGKTPFVTQIIAANCEAEIPCLLFSQEMTKQAVLSRCIPLVTKGAVTGWKLRNPKRMEPSERAMFMESKAVLDQWPLWVNDASSVTAGEFTSHATMMIRKHGIKLVAVDYIQLMQGEGDNRAQRISSCSAALRELAKKQKVVVIGVSQFGRPAEKMKRRPVLFDLKESGDVENDAHLVLLVYRPLDKKTGFTRMDEIIVAKQREGPVDSVPVMFDNKQLVFLPRAAESGESNAESWYEK
jgi:replicative DNA helicase